MNDQERFELVMKIVNLIDEHEWNEEEIREAVEDGIGESHLGASVVPSAPRPKKPKKF